MRTKITVEKEEMSEQELQEQRDRIEGEGGAA